MITKEDIQTTLNYWIQNRIHGISASMCVGAEDINLYVLSVLDQARREFEKSIASVASRDEEE